MVKIRLMRMGKRKQPYYRVVVADARSPRDGRFLENIGKYHPRSHPSVIDIDEDRALHWLRQGAQPSDPVRVLFQKTGVWGRFTGQGPTEAVPPPAETDNGSTEAPSGAATVTDETAEAPSGAATVTDETAEAPSGAATVTSPEERADQPEERGTGAAEEGAEAAPATPSESEGAGSATVERPEEPASTETEPGGGPEGDEGTATQEEVERSAEGDEGGATGGAVEGGDDDAAPETRDGGEETP